MNATPELIFRLKAETGAARAEIKQVADGFKHLTTISAAAGQSLGTTGRGFSNLLQVSGAGRFVLQNTAAQLGDIAVQLQGGTIGRAHV